MTDKVAICWFRQDLRVSDNPALVAAAKHQNVLPIYILDNENAGDYAYGGASHWWLHHSLAALQKSLGGQLSVYQGNPQAILQALISRLDVEAVYWNRCYEPWQIDRDTQLKGQLKSQGLKVDTFNGSLLWEPWQVSKKDGTYYKVFTPFYRKGCLQAEPPREPLAKPENVSYVVDADQQSIEQLNLLPKIPWDAGFSDHWHIGEEGAYERFQTFIKEGLSSYKEGRNIPSEPFVSRLSPHLRWGEISPNQLWHLVRNIGDDSNIDHFCSELGWREFSYSQLFHNPDLPRKNLQAKFDGFPWAENDDYLRAWQRGQTGVPMVDAGMRELWQTGYMHNRVRMIVGSYLVKNLRLHWHHGERWFWDTLVDADLANNSASWQWIAGCGADAAPYFRIFNPVTQGQKFDPQGHYIRQYIPEIAGLPNKYLFSPWEAPAEVLQAAGVKLDSTYPSPIVNLKQSREAALEAFKSLKPQEK
jgi:deoxyribodipyrimidine photo-lyase